MIPAGGDDDARTYRGEQHGRIAPVCRHGYRRTGDAAWRAVRAGSDSREYPTVARAMAAQPAQPLPALHVLFAPPALSGEVSRLASHPPLPLRRLDGGDDVVLEVAHPVDVA